MKWQYKRKIISQWLGGEIDDAELNELGKRGWEVFHISSQNDGRTLVAYAKRPKDERDIPSRQ